MKTVYSLKEYTYFILANLIHKSHKDKQREIERFSLLETAGGQTLNDSILIANQNLKNSIFKK